MSKIKDGRFTISSDGEPICIETCLFLLDCLQIHEEDRLSAESLLSSPFISEKFAGFELHEIDYAAFQRDLLVENARLDDSNVPYERVTDSDNWHNVDDNELVLTIKPSFMRRVLVKQLIGSSELAFEDLHALNYFTRYQSCFNSSMRDPCGDFGSIRQLEQAHYERLVGSIIRSFQIPSHEVVQESEIESATGGFVTKRQNKNTANYRTNPEQQMEEYNSRVAQQSEHLETPRNDSKSYE